MLKTTLRPGMFRGGSLDSTDADNNGTRGVDKDSSSSSVVNDDSTDSDSSSDNDDNSTKPAGQRPGPNCGTTNNGIGKFAKRIGTSAG